MNDIGASSYLVSGPQPQQRKLESPEVSVVIPTRNRWPLLVTALSSALGQEDVDLEVVVVDDGSSDETAARLAGVSDSRLRVIRHERSFGVARARNTGLSSARGEWVAFLDDDDVWAPKKLRMQVDKATASGACFVYGAAVVVDEDAVAIQYDIPPPDPGELPRRLLVRNAIPAAASNVLANTEMVRGLGGFDERSRFDDWDLHIRLATAGRAAVCHDILVGYRRHRGNMVLGYGGDLGCELEYLAKKHHALIAGYGVEFDRVAFSRWLAWGHARAGRRREALRRYLRGTFEHRDLAHLAGALATLLGGPAARVRRRMSRTPDPSEVTWLERYS